MQKVKLDNNGDIVDTSNERIILCCNGTGAFCNTDCAAYSEGTRVIDNEGTRAKIANCNAFKFTIGELQL
ncbi:hypothetical protein LCGC14_0415960 [marine sediment metagenome]|uniref:Uncharacterized protein n=1 Tax=marine sediment metagenome TaxID=412755 RepID=A0A0F9SSH6_9ZZZZ